MKLVHNVKQEAGSRDEARHTERSNQVIFREEAVCGRASVTTSEEWVILEFEER